MSLPDIYYCVSKRLNSVHKTELKFTFLLKRTQDHKQKGFDLDFKS